MEATKKGRPPLPAEAKRRHKVQLRVNTEELELLQAEADQHHVALSTWVRMKILTTTTNNGMATAA